MTHYDPFRGYDQWKTASPYDDDLDIEVEGIAGLNMQCPACGYHDNISTARWTVEIEQPDQFNDLTHDEVTFTGWHCEVCDWQQEAIKSDFERKAEYEKSYKPRIDAIHRKIANCKRKPAISIDHFFELAPEGDFKWDDTGDGDWHVYCCGEKDCPRQWHKFYPTCDIGRENGKRYVELGDTDEDGNHDFQTSYDERESDCTPEWWHDIGETLANSSRDYFLGWTNYWLDCAETGLDPLDECSKRIDPGFDWIKFCVEAAESFAKYLD